jgi:hypothetical protein
MFLCLLLTVGTLTSVFKDNMSLRSHKTVEIMVYLNIGYFRRSGTGSGSALTYNAGPISGSAWKPMRIHNTASSVWYLIVDKTYEYLSLFSGSHSWSDQSGTTFSHSDSTPKQRSRLSWLWTEYIVSVLRNLNYLLRFRFRL